VVLSQSQPEHQSLQDQVVQVDQVAINVNKVK
jgi:hypothetical protein